MALSLMDAPQILQQVSDDANAALRVTPLNSLVRVAYDYIALTYVASGDGVGEIETVTYKSGGAAGTIVATLTLAYDTNNNLASVTLS